jgi:dienelactone hydrolase
MPPNLRLLLFSAAALLLGGCATPSEHADRLAARGGFTRVLIEGSGFDHVAYERFAPSGPLFVFIEGDGVPWVADGRQIAEDPTPREPLALELAASTKSAPVMYLGRPCYFGLARSSACRPSDWTAARYSPRVIKSLATAVNRVASAHEFSGVVLVGYSGGGTLAVLMAPGVEKLHAVITVAANLDVAAWTRYHGYLPLSGSLDPADGSPLAANLIQIHLAGGADQNVPPALMQRYLAAHPAAQVWTFAGFDHACCWQRAWPLLLPRLLERVGNPAGAVMACFSRGVALLQSAASGGCDAVELKGRLAPSGWVQPASVSASPQRSSQASKQ